MKFKNLKFILSVITLSLLTLVISVKPAQAANFTTASIRYDRMKENTPSSLQIVIVPATAGTEAKIKLVFASATLGANVSQPVTVTNIPTGTTELPGTLVALGNGTSIVVSGVSDLTVGTTYAFNLSLGVTNPAAGSATDTVSTLTSGDATIDSSSIGSRYITNDQITIIGVVPPSFNFVLSGNTDSFTTDLAVGDTVSTTGKTVTITTNAAKGWIAWVKSANFSLSSATTGSTIPTTGTVNGTPSTLSVGTNGYVLDANLTQDSGTGTGTVTIAGEYNGTDTASGGTLSTIFQPFASCKGTTAGDIITLIARATISAVLPAASDYTDLLTVVGAGSF